MGKKSKKKCQKNRPQQARRPRGTTVKQKGMTTIVTTPDGATFRFNTSHDDPSSCVELEKVMQFFVEKRQYGQYNAEKEQELAPLRMHVMDALKERLWTVYHKAGELGWMYRQFKHILELLVPEVYEDVTIFRETFDCSMTFDDIFSGVGATGQEMQGLVVGRTPGMLDKPEFSYMFQFYLKYKNWYGIDRSSLNDLIEAVKRNGEYERAPAWYLENKEFYNGVMEAIQFPLDVEGFEVDLWLDAVSNFTITDFNPAMLGDGDGLDSPISHPVIPAFHVVQTFPESLCDTLSDYHKKLLAGIGIVIEDGPDLAASYQFRQKAREHGSFFKIYGRPASRQDPSFKNFIEMVVRRLQGQQQPPFQPWELDVLEAAHFQLDVLVSSTQTDPLEECRDPRGWIPKIAERDLSHRQEFFDTLLRFLQETMPRSDFRDGEE